MMSRKNYVGVAAVIKQNLDTVATAMDGTAVYACKDIALGLAWVFSQDNPRFDRTRFLQACGLDVS